VAKLNLKINREKLLKKWKENGHLKDLLNTYLNEPDYLTQEINSNGQFKLDFHDVCANMEQIPLSCFTEESQELLKENKESLGFNGESIFWYNSRKDELLTNENRENIMIITELE